MFRIGRGRALIAALIAVPATVSAVLVAAPTAAAATALSGIVLDTIGSDGSGLATPASHLSPTYATTLSTWPAYGTPTGYVINATKPNTAGAQPYVTFEPPTGGALVAGQTYPLADVRDASHATVTVSGQGCSGLVTGNVAVAEATPASPTFSALAFTFTKHCATNPNDLYGEVRYNSTVDITATTAVPWSTTFAGVPAGTSTSPRTFTVTNAGSVPDTLGQATIGGTDAADFALGSDGCSGATIDVGATCTFNVTATPEAGVRTATVTLPDGSARGARIVGLNATGQTIPSVPQNLATRTASDGVAVTWSGPADWGHATSSGYQVLRGTTADNLAVVGTTFGSSYPDRVGDTTSVGTTYYYAVRAVNSVGTGDATAAVAGTTPDAVVVPSARKVMAVEGDHSSAVGQDASYLYQSSADHPNVVTLGGSPTATIYVSTNPVGLPPCFFQLTAPQGGSLGVGTYPIGVNDATHASGTFQLGDGQYSAGSITITRMDIDASGAMVTFDADVTMGGLTASVRYATDDPLTAISLPPVDGGTTAVGTPVTTSATYTNVGDTPVTVSSVAVAPVAGAAATDWSTAGADTCTGNLIAAGASCSIGLSVTPTAAGNDVGDLVVTDNTPTGTHHRALTVFAKVPPSAPSTLTASRAADGRVTLAWSDVSPASGRADSFTISAGSSPDALTPLATQAAAASDYNTYTDPNTASTVRYYAVTATDIAGTGPATALTVDATLHTPGDVAVSPMIGRAVVQWSEPVGYPAGPVTYDVYRGASPSSLVKVASPTATSSDFSGLAAGSTYWFAVRARTANGDASPLAPPVSVVVPRSELVVTTWKPTLGPYGGDAVSHASLTPGSHGESSFPTSGVDAEEVAASPNGTRIAFTAFSLQTGYPQGVFVEDAGGVGTAWRVASIAGDDEEPAWSQNNATIAFTRYPDTGPSTLYTVSANGSSAVQIPNSANLSSPTWLGPRTLIAEDDSSPTAALVRIDVATGARTTVPNSAGSVMPSVKPDGSEVAFVVPHPDHSFGLDVVTLSTGASRVIPVPANNDFGSSISWSRDQTTLYYEASTSWDSQIWRSAASGGVAAVQVTSLSGSPGSAAVVTPDTLAPTVKATPLPAFTLTGSVKLTYSGIDTYNGVRSYDVRYTRATATAVSSAVGATGTSGTTATSLTMKLAPGIRYCFSVRATDRAGNVSPWTTPTCTTTPMDDRSLRRSAGFAAATGSAYYLGTVASGKLLGQVLSTSLTEQPLYLVATTCKACGSVEIRKGTTRIALINLASSTTVNRRIIAIPVKAVAGAVSIRIVSSGKPVLIDGVVLKPA